jgi:chromosome segregation ATPase
MARINSLQKLALLAPGPCRKDLEALISSLQQQQLKRATAQEGTSVQATSQLHSSKPYLASQQCMKCRNHCLDAAHCQLQASQEQIAAQQHQLAELRKDLAAERSSHALTAAREDQATAALLAGQQLVSSAMSSAQSDEQALQGARVEVALLRAQLHAADQAAAKHKAATGAAIAHLQQQLFIAQAQLQQQRQATAAAQVASAGKTFACARLSAQANNLSAELQECQKQQQAAIAAASMIMTERKSAQQQLQAALIRLASAQKELQDAQAQAAELQQELGNCRKLLSTRRHTAADVEAVAAVLQDQLDECKLQLRQQFAAATPALAKAEASRWEVASSAAPCAQLQQQYSAAFSELSSEGFVPATPSRRTGSVSSSTGSSRNSSSGGLGMDVGSVRFQVGASKWGPVDASGTGQADDVDVFYHAQDLLCDAWVKSALPAVSRCSVC